MKKMKICLGCLRPIQSEEIACPFCGFDPNIVSDKKMLHAGILLYHRYYVGRVLGEGGFGITYTGYDISEKRPVAIKEYFPANIAQRNISQENPDFVIPFDGDNGNVYQRGLDRFAQEAKVLKKLTKLSHVVKVYDYFLQNNTGYLIMEYVPGVTLRQYVTEHGVFSTQKMLDIIRPIAIDLSVMHDMGMVHRDISPDNILLQANGVAKVIDFGTTRTILKKEDGTNKTMTVMLRHQYAPKEQYLPNGCMGAWSDVYSLCATIYFMLLGQNPDMVFEREPKDIVKKCKEIDNHMDAKLIHVLEKGMEICHEKRYQTMQAFLTDLEAVIEGENAKSQPTDHTIYVDREKENKKYMPYWKKKRYALLCIGLALLVAVAGKGMSFFLYSGGNQNGTKPREQVEKTKVIQETAKPTGTPASEPENGEELVVVPKVEGKKWKEASRLLHQVDPDLIIILEKEYTEKGKKNCVIAQSIAAGESYRETSQKEIILTVSVGSAQGTAAKSQKTSNEYQKNTKTTESPVVSEKPSQTARPQKTKVPEKNIKIITQD